MATQRILRFACALGFAIVALAATSSAPALAQDVTVSMVPVSEQPAVVELTTTTVATTAAEEDTVGTQERVEAEPAVATRLASENRRVLAAIGGLLIVALGISVLTIRYYRATAPVPAAAPTASASVTVGSGDGFPARPSRRAVAGADHATVDDDYEPQGTGENEVVDVSAGPAIVRPSAAARRRALQPTGDG